MSKNWQEYKANFHPETMVEVAFEQPYFYIRLSHRIDFTLNQEYYLSPGTKSEEVGKAIQELIKLGKWPQENVGKIKFIPKIATPGMYPV